MIFLGDFFLALDKDGDGNVGCKDFASRMAASGKLPAGVDIEGAIEMVMNTYILINSYVVWHWQTAML